MEEPTTFIHIQEFDYGSSKRGIFAISTAGRSEDGPERLVLEATDGRARIFRAVLTREEIRRDLSRVKVPENVAPPSGSVKHLLSLLIPSTTKDSDGADTDVLRRTFQLVEDQLKIQVSEHRSSGLSLVTFATTVPRASESDMVNFVKRLVDRKKRLEAELRDQNTRLQQVKRQREEWKDTAHKLERGWEGEKNKLLSNFLQLYDAKQQQVKQTQSQLEDLQKEVQSLKEQIAASGGTHAAAASRATGRRHELPDYLQNLPDDLNEEMYDEETIARLAAGPQRGQKKAAAATKKRKKPTKITTKQMKGRNEITGATEYYESSAVLEDETLWKTAGDDEASDSNKPEAKKHKEEEAKSAPTGKGRSKAESAASPADSSSDDSCLDADVLAQLDALREDD
jgi:hypothetical protein